MDNNVNALRVVVHSRRNGGQLTPMPLKRGSLRLTCIAAVVGMALDLLESRPSIRALSSYTLRLADEARDIPILRNLKQGEERELVQEFLSAIRASTPHILVTQENGMSTKNGRTNKFDCPSRFDPKRAAVLELNEKIVMMLADACNDLQVHKSAIALARFQTLLCRISITFAHELVHVYTLFLRREKGKHTPPNLTYGGYGNRVAGEAGRFWELKVFGGYIDMRAGSHLEAIALRGNQAGKVWRLRSQLIERLIARDFSWLDEPLTEPDHPNRRQATEPTDAYKWVNRYHDIFPEEPSRQNGPQELSSSQLRELLELDTTQFPAYSVRGADLRAFCYDPTVRVQIS